MKTKIILIYLLSVIFKSNFITANSDDGGIGDGFGGGVAPSGDAPPTGPCGPYGFRCIDERYFQLCAFRDINGQTERPDIVHECHDKNVCDEDNPAYCSSPATGWQSQKFQSPDDEDDRKIMQQKKRFTRKSKHHPNIDNFPSPEDEAQANRNFICSKFGFFEGICGYKLYYYL